MQILFGRRLVRLSASANTHSLHFTAPWGIEYTSIQQMELLPRIITEG